MNAASCFRLPARVLGGIAVSLCLSAAGAQAMQNLNLLRPDYQNPTPTNSPPRERGVIFFPGHHGSLRVRTRSQRQRRKQWK